MLSECEIRKNLSDDGRFSFILLQDCASTNDTAKELAKSGAPHLTVVISEHQSEGRGRLVRHFYSPCDSGLWMSVILKTELPVEEIYKVTPYAAVAVSEAIKELTTSDVQIKWVNDLFINGRKICGILTETVFSEGMPKYIIVGIGVNVNHIVFPDELKNIASSIEDECGVRIQREALAAEILSHIALTDVSIIDGIFIEEYRKRQFIVGRNVTVNHPDGRIYEAMVKGIGDDFSLIIEHDGKTEHMIAGEVSIRGI